jgi:hypothetical protein
MASMRALEAVCIPVTWVLMSSHSPFASNADFCAIRSLTRVAPRVCKADTGLAKDIALLRVRLPLPLAVVVPSSMVVCKPRESLSIADESLVKALTSSLSVDIPDPTAVKISVIVDTFRLTSVGSRSMRMGSAVMPRTKVMNGRMIVDFILMSLGR